MNTYRHVLFVSGKQSRVIRLAAKLAIIINIYKQISYILHTICIAYFARAEYITNRTAVELSIIHN